MDEEHSEAFRAVDVYRGVIVLLLFGWKEKREWMSVVGGWMEGDRRDG